MNPTDLRAAVLANRARLVFAPALVDWLGQAAGEPALAREVLGSGELGEAFARLVAAAQTGLGLPADGQLSATTLRAVRRHLGLQSRAVGLQREGITIPETEVKRGLFGRYPDRFDSARLGPITITGGFMEPHGHSAKGTTYAIFRDAPETIRTLEPSDRNLGIDYVVTSADKHVRAWYGGLVLAAGLDGGYGLRVTVETDVAFELGGAEYPVHQAYGHGAVLLVPRGVFVEPGQALAVMGGTGQGGATVYGEHVDLRTWITVGGRRVDLSPNVLDSRLPVDPPPQARVMLAHLGWGALGLGLAGTAALAWRASKGATHGG